MQMIANYPVADCHGEIPRYSSSLRCISQVSWASTSPPGQFAGRRRRRERKRERDALCTGWHASRTTGEQESVMHSVMPRNTTARHVSHVRPATAHAMNYILNSESHDTPRFRGVNGRESTSWLYQFAVSIRWIPMSFLNKATRSWNLLEYVRHTSHS